MKNHELIANVGGIEKAREIVAGAPVNAESYQDGYYFRLSPEFMYHNGVHEQWNMTTNDGEWFKKTEFSPIPMEDLRTAIAEHDAPEFKVGDLVVGGKYHRGLLEIVDFKNGYAIVGKYSRVALSPSNIRHATQSEIEAGHREPLGNPEQLDDVADIKYHVSPLTVVTELHVSEALRLNELG